MTRLSNHAVASDDEEEEHKGMKVTVKEIKKRKD